MRRLLAAMTGLALVSALMTACGNGGSATATPVSPAEQLKALSGRVTAATDALKANDIKKAQTEYKEFDEGWDRIEDGIRAKSADSYRKIEDAMSEVKGALLTPANPDGAKAQAALNKLAETINAEVPKLR